MTEMHRIQAFIEERGVKSFLYHTNRDIESGKGKLRILVVEDGIARTEYICPYCQKHGYQENKWERPYSFKCDSCKKTIKVPKMKDQVKRDMKKKSAEED